MPIPNKIKAFFSERAGPERERFEKENVRLHHPYNVVDKTRER